MPELAKRWRWSKGKVNRFLMELQTDTQIELQKTNVSTLISICNYERYQGDDTANDTANSTANGLQMIPQMGSQTDTNKNVKKNKEEEEVIGGEGGFAPPTPPQVSGFNYLPEGRSYIEPTVFFTKKDFNGLPTEKQKEIVRFLSTTKNIDLEPEKVNDLWATFKEMELTFQKPYRNKEDVYRHFLNWTKKQTFSKTRTARPKAIKNEKVVGVEFLDDFTKCKMSDDSVIELDANQRDIAKFAGLKPEKIRKP